MRAQKNGRPVARRVPRGFEALLAQFSAATLEFTSVARSEFARRLTEQAAEMLGARSAAFAVKRNDAWEMGGRTGPGRPRSASVEKRLAAALGGLDWPDHGRARSGSAAELLGPRWADRLAWETVCIAPLIGREEQVLGVLCLGDLEREMSAIEAQLLAALLNHASVALENAQLLHRVEQSRKQWVEDFDAISDFIVVHDTANRVLRLNRALADSVELELIEAIGQPIEELGILGTAAPQGQCPFCHHTNSPEEEDVYQAGERTYLVSSSRAGGPTDQDSRTIHVLKDITDRRKAERRYCRERDFNRNILNSTHSMILVLDTAGLISYANRRCAEAGYDKADLLGKPLTGMVGSAHQPLLLAALNRTLEGVSIDNLEIPLRGGDGHPRQFSVSLSPMRDEDGVINSIVAAMSDVTDAADLQAKLMQTEKMAALGQLVSGVAHEVNNPLAAIVGFTDLLLENRDVPASAKEELRVILQEAERTRVIVHNLLSFARQKPPRREPLEVNSVLQQTVRLRTYDFANHGVEIREHYQRDLPIVLGDPHELQQVFLNILNNAYDAVHEAKRPGKIEIETSAENGRIDIAFRDNGPGISQPDRIFDPFFTTKEVGKGTGLGLSICYGIVRAHRGEIIAANHPDGVGCTFTIHLPAAPAPAET
ncbi:MAG TPA: ATP-binding protein [Candidatus Cybelea sp.]|nr:ATP-binding protein [Candidatus Cybelea sp.]